MANLPWRVSVRLVALAKKTGMVVGIVLVVLLAVRAYLSQQGPELHLWLPGGPMMSVREMDNADFTGGRRAHAAKPLLPPEPGVAGTVYARCQPLLCADACRKAPRRGSAAARFDGLALQRPAACRELSTARLYGRGPAPARARHRARRADGRRLGDVAGGDASCGAGSHASGG
ncbi:hypothetical protein L1887_45631 [Cichorium endivia]|nr:hypothetical protein L1887_45631 [Cichorium endivia]